MPARYRDEQSLHNNSVFPWRSNFRQLLLLAGVSSPSSGASDECRVPTAESLQKLQVQTESLWVDRVLTQTRCKRRRNTIISTTLGSLSRHEKANQAPAKTSAQKQRRRVYVYAEWREGKVPSSGNSCWRKMVQFSFYDAHEPYWPKCGQYEASGAFFGQKSEESTYCKGRKRA